MVFYVKKNLSNVLRQFKCELKIEVTYTIFLFLYFILTQCLYIVKFFKQSYYKRNDYILKL